MSTYASQSHRCIQTALAYLEDARWHAEDIGDEQTVSEIDEVIPDLRSINARLDRARKGQ